VSNLPPHAPSWPLPEGYRLVPTVPTAAMHKAMADTPKFIHPAGEVDWIMVYMRALAYAPVPSPVSEKGDTTAPIGDHPRTDALGLPCTRSDQYGEVVPAKAFWGMLQHARTLERELAEAKDDLEDSRAACRLTYGLKESFKERADTAEAALAAAHTRLEANFYFDNGGDRIDCEPGEIPDGIACRDETIKGQDKIIAELRAALAAAARDEREACAVICDGIGAETAATMIRAGRVS
jgi:hypothetical protein